MRVASTAVSIVPCPDIITTGIVSCPLADHSLRRDAVGVGHPDVEQHQIRALFAADAARPVAFSASQTSVTFVRDLRKEFADADFVIDDQDLRHLPGFRKKDSSGCRRRQRQADADLRAAG